MFTCSVLNTNTILTVGPLENCWIRSQSTISTNQAGLEREGHTMLVEYRGTATLTVLCSASSTWPSEAARPTVDFSLDASSHSDAVHWKPSGLIFPQFHALMHRWIKREADWWWWWWGGVKVLLGSSRPGNLARWLVPALVMDRTVQSKYNTIKHHTNEHHHAQVTAQEQRRSVEEDDWH